MSMFRHSVLLSITLAFMTFFTQPAFAEGPKPSVLLLGASTPPRSVFLRHALDALREHFRGAGMILVIVDASNPDDRDRQTRRIDAILHEATGCRTVALHTLNDVDALATIRSCDGVFAGGGQTFLLLRSLYDRGLIQPLRERILAGLPYAGSSAGSNIAGPVIGTTNDFPVIDIPTRRALAVFPAVINPHHPLAESADFAGRAGKIRGYLALNPQETVLGLSEPAIVRLAQGRVVLIAGPAWVYRPGEVREFHSGDDLTEALDLPQQPPNR